MMNAPTIWKFALETTDVQTFYLPYAHRNLTIQIQNGNPYLWCLVRPDNERVERKFRTYGTGHPVNEPLERLEYVGNYQLCGGQLVFHVFEEKD